MEYKYSGITNKYYKDFNFDYKSLDNFYARLNELNLDDLLISDYTRSYFRNMQRNLYGHFQKYLYLLNLSMKSVKDIGNAVFIEYGGGHGLFSLIAKASGVGTVIYNDIYDISCRDAEIIADVLDLKANHYLCGDIEEVVFFVNDNDIRVDAISSYDVIEHIYDLEKFVSELKKIKNSDLNMVFASGANKYNPLLNYLLVRQQKHVENNDRNPEKGHKDRDSTRSYLEIRKKIIKDNFSDIENELIHDLALRTRGLIGKDIISHVKNYLQTGIMEYKPIHKTNTCDPLTGNWCEQLLSKEYLYKLFKDNGIEIELFGGFHKSYSNTFFRIIGYFANIIISLNQKSLVLSPEYIIYKKTKR